MFTKAFDKRVYQVLLVLLGTTVVGVSFSLYALWPDNVESGYQPEQPLAYSHELHAGELKIPCLYCHTGADRCAHAGVPALATCMKCHQEVQSKDSRGQVKPATALLLEHWERQAPIHWVKVNNVADFVYFDHSRHVSYWDAAAGAHRWRIECQECHGPVEEMEVVYRESSLKMGWCLECHRQEPRPDTAPGLTSRGPTHCSACHR